MHKLILILSFFIVTAVQAQPWEERVSGIELSTIDREKFMLKDMGEIKVIVFLSPDCPLSQKYTRTLNELAKEYDGKAKICGVFLDNRSLFNDYKDFRKKYIVGFTLVVDKNKRLAKGLHASITPEAFVLSKDEVIYHGAIDDWVIELGKTKKNVSVNYVRDAINAAITHTNPVNKYIKPIGCFID